MKYRPLGRTVVLVSPYGLGTMIARQFVPILVGAVVLTVVAAVPVSAQQSNVGQPTVRPHLPPVTAASPIISFSPLTFEVPGRLAPLEMRVVAPVEGEDLPVILFSHGHGDSNFLSSMRGYGPLVDFYAAHGYVVIIPTHQNSKTLALDPTGPEGPLFWRSRVEDMHFILDHLEEVEAAVPGLAGRIDETRIAAVGHSLGGHSVAMLAGMTVTNATGEVVDLSEPRIAAAIMFSPPGDGADMASAAAERFPELVNNDFSGMTLPSFVITGDRDFSPVFSAREDWRADAYRLSPGANALLTLYGGEHMFGGISGYDAKETTDEDPDRVAALQRVSWAYLQTALYPENDAWHVVAEEYASGQDSTGRLETK